MSQTIAPWLTNSRWPTVPIRLVARLGTGHTPSRSVPAYWEDCTIPWITLADVWQLRSGTQSMIGTTKEKISPLGMANSAAVRHPAGTVILSRTASVGFSAIMGADMATSQDFATWTCGPRLEPRFLLHALRAAAPDLRRVATGSTHKTIYMPDIEQLRVPLPPRDEQRRIANFLDAETARIDELVNAQRRVVTLLKERCTQTLESTLIPAGAYEQIPLGLLTSYTRPIMYGIVLPGPSVDDGVPIVKGGDVAAGRLRLAQLSRTTFAIEAGYARSRLVEGDLVIAIRGSVGEVGVVPAELAGANLTQDAARIAPGRNTDGRWLELMLRTPTLVKQIQSRITGATVKGINIWDLKRVLVPRLSLSEQRASIARVELDLTAMHRLSTVTERQLALLTERRQALITAAVTGQIDVTTARGVDVP